MKPTKDGKALLYHLIGYAIAGIAFVKLFGAVILCSCFISTVW